MAGFERATTIAAPAEAIFSYLADFTRHGEWAGHRLEIEKTSEGPVGVGSTFACVGHQMGTHRGKVTITEFAPSSRIIFESADDTGRFRHHFLLEESVGQTRLAKGVEPLEITSFLFRLLSPILGLVVPRGLEGDLRRIRARLEG